MITQVAKNNALSFDAQLKKSWPIVLFVAALTSYAAVCLVGLVLGMTYVGAP